MRWRKDRKKPLDKIVIKMQNKRMKRGFSSKKKKSRKSNNKWNK